MGVNKQFSVNEMDHLTLRGVDLVDLCGKYGTPLFVFDECSLIENFQRFKQAFESLYPKVMVCYSVKTNNNLALCKILRERGAYAEVSSTLDLHVALNAGFTGDQIIYDGPFKPVKALEEALKSEVLLVNCESFVELERLNKVAEKFGVIQSIGLRVNGFRQPGFLRSLHPKTLLDEAAFCFPSCRFGFSVEEVRKAFKYLKNMKNLRLEGLMTHPYNGATDLLMPLFRTAVENLGFEIKYLNIGGGFNHNVCGSTGDLSLALDYVKTMLGLKSSLDSKKKFRSIEDIAVDVVESVKRNLDGLSKPILVAEPGRFVIGPSGILLLKVDHVKVAGGYMWVIVDGGTNLIPIIYDRRGLLVANRASASNKELVNVVGPLLYAKDFVAIKASLPRVMEGDVIAVLDCGAYSLSNSSQFLYPRPHVVLVNSDGKEHVIRERETFEDVLGKDKLF